MYISLSQQYTAFLYAFLIGAGLGVVYDVFRVLRLITLKSAIAVFVQDILFWLICLLVTFTFTLVYNNGELRFFIILAETLGFLSYYFTLGRLVFKVFKTLFNFIRKILGKIYNFFGKIRKKALKNVKKPLQNEESM